MTQTAEWSTYTSSNDEVPADLAFPDRFIKHKKVGRGGYGVVLSAYDRLLETEVALKISSKVDSIKTEVVRLRSLPSQYFVRPFDYGETEGPAGKGFAWYSMEYLTSDDGWICLDKWISVSKPFSAKHNQQIGHAESQLFSLFVVKEVAFGLSELHQNRITKTSHFHGDIKPQNIFFNVDAIRGWRDGRAGVQGPFAKLIDLGLSRMSGHTAQGGTDGYMSPEQINGSACGPKADAYVVGVLLFDLLTDFAYRDSARPVTKLQIRSCLKKTCPTKMLEIATDLIARSLASADHVRISCDDIARDLDDIFTALFVPSIWRLIRHMEQIEDNGDGDVRKPELLNRLQDDFMRQKGMVNRTEATRQEAKYTVNSAISSRIIKSSGRNVVGFNCD